MIQRKLINLLICRSKRLPQQAKALLVLFLVGECAVWHGSHFALLAHLHGWLRPRAVLLGFHLGMRHFPVAEYDSPASGHRSLYVVAPDSHPQSAWLDGTACNDPQAFFVFVPSPC